MLSGSTVLVQHFTLNQDNSLKRHTLYTCLVQTVRSVLGLSNSSKGWSVICLLSVSGVPSNAMKALALRRLAGTTVVFFVLACIPTFGQVTPQAAGIYADQNGTPQALSPAAYSGSQQSNNVVKANVAWTFRGAHSPLQLSSNRPRFVLVCGLGAPALAMLCGLGTGQPGDLIMVRLDEKSDHRESRMASAGMFGGHSGFDAKKTVTTTIVKRNIGGWDVVPTQDLKDGEYLITTGVNPQGFDFGIGGPQLEPAPSQTTAEPSANSSNQSAAREMLLKTFNASFAREGVAGYAEISGDKLLVHSERATEMRFHMQVANQRLIAMMQQAGIATYLYTNDADQHFAYDLKAGKIILPTASQATKTK
jgi:hypothetical protein